MPAGTHSHFPSEKSRGKKNSRSRTASAAGKGAATAAGKSLDQAQYALDQAAKSEKHLRASLKKHSKRVRAVRADLDRGDKDLKTMKSQLKKAKKSRKQAAKAVHAYRQPRPDGCQGQVMNHRPTVLSALAPAQARFSDRAWHQSRPGTSKGCRR